MGCVYTYNGTEYSYDDLIKELQSDEAVNDLVYSINTKVQERVIEKIDSLKQTGLKEGIPEFRTSIDETDITSGGAELNVPNGVYTPQTLVDSSLFTSPNGEAMTPVLRVDNYLQVLRDNYEKMGLSQEEIKRKLDLIKTSWKQIATDGRDIHKILLHIGESNPSYTAVEKLTKDTAFARVTDEIKEKCYQVFSQVAMSNGKSSNEYEANTGTVIRKNINVSAKLKHGETVTGHIDYIAIHPDGSVEVFNIKASHEDPSLWDSAKKEKYQYEFAILAQILQYNGISAKNIKFHVLPIVVNYNNDFSEVTGITIKKSQCYSHRRDAFILGKQMQQAARFIETNVDSVTINQSSIDTVNTQLKALFPEKNIQSMGIISTVKEYIDKNFNFWIRKEQPEKGYLLTINGQDYRISDNARGSANAELVELITKNAATLLDPLMGNMSASSIVSSLKQFRAVGFPNFNTPYLNSVFAPYFEHTKVKTIDGEKRDYVWKIIENTTLNDCNVIIFKNRDTNQINVVTVSNQNLDTSQRLGGNDNILGFHLSGGYAVDSNHKPLRKATYGNIETMRVMVLLNELLPKLPQDVELGNITIIGGIGTKTTGQTTSIQEWIPTFLKVQQVLNSKDNTLKIQNNFANAKSISPVKLFLNEFWSISEGVPGFENTDLGSIKQLVNGDNTDGTYTKIGDVVYDSLASADTVEVQIQRLEELIHTVEISLKTYTGYISPQNLATWSQRSLNSGSPSDRMITAGAKILVSATEALNQLCGNANLQVSKLTSVERYACRPQNMSDDNVRMVSRLLEQAIHSVSIKIEPVISSFNNACLEYYKAKGYTSAQNETIGNQASVFQHLFVDESSDLIFKNPWNMTNGLDDADRKFLKRVLWEIHRTKYGKDFPYDSSESTKFKEFMLQKDSNFNVPLEKASHSTRWSDPKTATERFKQRCKDYCKDPSKFFKEMYEDIISEEESQQIDRDIENLQTYNQFRVSESEQGRTRLFGTARNYIPSNPKKYFETNLQNLVIDYVYKDSQEYEMNKMLVRARGILVGLRLAGVRENNPEKYQKTIQHIDDYIKTAVYRRSIMEDHSKNLVAKIQPLRKAMSAAYIALNPVGAVRDTVGGFMSNMIRAVTKFRTDIDGGDVLWAYQFVLGKGVHSAMSINLLDKFNQKYLISNINREKLQEAYKTDKGGVLNAGNWAYATLRKPDFLNRMVLFIARLKHDGSIKAYSIVNGQLQYDWRKDKRFSLLANNDTSNLAEYNKQKGLYLSLLRKFNMEGYNLEVSMKTDLPDGYTLKQIDGVKELGETIYGSYDISTKAMGENTALGSQFLVFSTWMNGIYDVYFGKQRESSYETQTIQAEENGQLLWLDKNGNITTENTGIPYYVDIPIIVQGVYYTLKDTLNLIAYKGLSKEVLSELWNDPMQRRNYKRMFSDIFWGTLLWALFKYIFTPAYQEHKKNDDGKAVLQNAFTELIYKGSSSSFEEFKGPIPIFDYVMNNTSPAAVKWGVKAYTDLFNMASGEKSVGEYITNTQAFPRAFQDTYKMWARDTANGITEEEA